MPPSGGVSLVFFAGNFIRFGEFEAGAAAGGFGILWFIRVGELKGTEFAAFVAARARDEGEFAGIVGGVVGEGLAALGAGVAKFLVHPPHVLECAFDVIGAVHFHPQKERPGQASRVFQKRQMPNFFLPWQNPIRKPLAVIGHFLQ